MIRSYFSTLPKAYKIPLIVVGVAVVGTAFVGGLGYIVMWLWNHTLAVVFDVPTLTFWEALGLFLLAKLFFGFGGGSGGGAKRERHGRHGHRKIGASAEEHVPHTDDLFKQYWRDEGKHAYEAYLEQRSVR